VIAQQNQSDWARLFQVGCGLIRQVNSEALIIDHWTLGGGTAMMLHIDHRESHDVDFFLQDPQLLPFLDPQKRDFKFEIWPNDYSGDGTGFLKLVFNDIGEIDFIVDQPKTAKPTIERVVEGEKTLLETVPEIITKKIVHRGSSIRPRDIFDIAAASEQYAESIVAALHPYKIEVAGAIKRLQLLNPEFVNNAISELQLREKFRPLAETAIERAKEILRAV
jgi:Nucleotidyl transferase AbiEii toxin, Type IV TA system